MTLEDLATLVKKMRAAQKRYFRNKDSQTLRLCKMLEESVDAAVKEVLDDERKRF